jgi:CRP/FNR family transcriptional regulator, cyclic AMP receptor protein
MWAVSLFSDATNGMPADPAARHVGVAAPVRTVAVFEEAPELLRGLADADAADLSRVRVPALLVERGPWEPPTLRADAHPHFGLLVLDGVMLRRVSLNGRTGAELLGSGDLLQPWVRQPPYDTLCAEPGWDVLERSRLAVLDQRFAARVAVCPEVAAALLGRATERARMLAFQHVASHIPGLEARLLSLVWALADRWGRVTPDGVMIPLPLTHATLAELVGASRPSVSTALSRLAREGILGRAPSGWLLEKSAPSERVRPGRGASTAPSGSAAPAARALG